MPDPRLLWFLSTERRSIYVEGQNFDPDAEGYFAVPENLGHMITVIPGFTYVGRKRPEGEKPEQSNFAKARSGRPEGFPWDNIFDEICRHVHYEGLPPTVAELTRYVQDWCENQYGKQPGDSTLKPKLGKLYQVLAEGRTLIFRPFSPISG